MSVLLEALGFRVTEHRPGKSRRAALRNMEQHWRCIGKVNNNAETSVLEARKP